MIRSGKVQPPSAFLRLYTFSLGRLLFFRQRDLAAFWAMAVRLVWLRDFARACPPRRPNSIAALLLPSWVAPAIGSSISPVAICITVTAFEITSAGRLWPLGVRGMLSAKDNTMSRLRTFLLTGHVQTVVWLLLVVLGSWATLLVIYGVVSATTGDTFAPLERVHTFLSSLFTLLSVLATLAALALPSHEPYDFSLWLVAPLVAVSVVAAMVFLVKDGSLPQTVLTGFSLLGLAGAGLRHFEPRSVRGRQQQLD